MYRVHGAHQAGPCRMLNAELTSAPSGARTSLWAITKGHPDVAIAVLDGSRRSGIRPRNRARRPRAGHGRARHARLFHHCGIARRYRPRHRSRIARGLDPDLRNVGSGGAGDLHAGGVGQPASAAPSSSGANIINVSASQQADLLSLSSDLNQALQAAAAAMCWSSLRPATRAAPAIPSRRPSRACSQSALTMQRAPRC